MMMATNAGVEPGADINVKSVMSNGTVVPWRLGAILGSIWQAPTVYSFERAEAEFSAMISNLKLIL